MDFGAGVLATLQSSFPQPHSELFKNVFIIFDGFFNLRGQFLYRKKPKDRPEKK
jgi:hypothetical protein